MPNKTRRDQIADWMAAYARTHGEQMPTTQEIADQLEISRTAVDQQITKLILEGRVARQDGKLWLTSATHTTSHPRA